MSAYASSDTPVMRQYLEVKERYPDCIVFFRLGDFYEMFYEDAVFAAEVLDLTLTSRDRNKENKIPMCGVPHHSAKQYIAKLVELGKKVALCEQVEDPKLAKKIVRRAVTQVMTPGVLLDEDQLPAKAAHYLAAVSIEKVHGQEVCGISFLDVSTGEFLVTQVEQQDCIEEVKRLSPAELLVINADDDFLAKLQSELKIPVGISLKYPHEDNLDLLIQSMRALGLNEENECFENTVMIQAAAACVRYAKATQSVGTIPLKELGVYYPNQDLTIDENTRVHLELFKTSVEQKLSGSLLSVIDKTKTAVGGRLLRKWLLSPSQNLPLILQRHDAVEWLLERHAMRDALQDKLKQVFDLERLASRLSLELASPKDLIRLAKGLAVIPHLQSILIEEAAIGDMLGKVPAFIHLGTDFCEDVAQAIFTAIVEDPPLMTKEGGVLKRGYHQGLDDIVELASGGRKRILEMEEKERQRTGISSLKIQYNRVFGFYIEITRTHLAKVPPDYMRKQTLAQAERFITKELSEYEAQVLSADEERLKLEQALFEALRKQLQVHVKRLMNLASRVAHLDALCSLAQVAHERGYVRPVMNDGPLIEVIEGRHPVIETLIPHGKFVPNDTILDKDQKQICLITGPNMAGKSTMMRQVALICILAQMGSFVPAKSATLGVLDRIFTRVGAADNLSKGESTFMVEMRETSHILKSATPRSLVVLDEIGRGTSTYDGISIAWAVAEYLHDRVGCKTLFATHYHELCALSETFPRIFNCSVAVKQWQGEVIFLHRLIPGGASRSYGIEVAKLAGLPSRVITRAKEILHELEQQRQFTDRPQLSLFSKTPLTESNSQESTASSLAKIEQEVLQSLRETSPQEMTPIKAMLFLVEICEKLNQNRDC